MKEGARLIHRKDSNSLIPISLLAAVEEQIMKLKKMGHIEKANDIHEYFSVKPSRRNRERQIG